MKTGTSISIAAAVKRRSCARHSNMLVLVAQAVPGGAWFGPLTWPWSGSTRRRRRCLGPPVLAK